MVAALGQAAERPGVAVAFVIVLALLEGAFLVWYRRYRGTMPSLASMPAEVAGAMRAFLGGAVIVVGAVVITAVMAGALAGAGLTFVAVTAGLVAYERRYAAAARATRERLA